MNKLAVVALFGGFALTASPAYAYIDPGTGGVLAQLLTGGVAGLLVLAKLYGDKIRAAFRFSSDKDGGGASTADPRK